MEIGIEERDRNGDDVGDEEAGGGCGWQTGRGGGAEGEARHEGKKECQAGRDKQQGRGRGRAVVEKRGRETGERTEKGGTAIGGDRL